MGFSPISLPEWRQDLNIGGSSGVRGLGTAVTATVIGEVVGRSGADRI